MCKVSDYLTIVDRTDAGVVHEIQFKPEILLIFKK